MRNTKSYIRNMKYEGGQVIVLLLLIMLVALSIGLALTQKSVSDVAISTQTEQSSRAFSAAEAGIEKALTGTVTSGSSFNLDNSAVATVATSALLPLAGSGTGIEYPPIGRETTAQFWFTDPNNSAVSYSSNLVDLYFGNKNTKDKPAIEVKILMESSGKFVSKVYYFDSDTSRTSTNNFTPVSGCLSVTLIKGILGDGHEFYCRYRLGPIPNVGGSGNCPSATCKLILARIRFLYSNETHKLALAPVGSDFPPQVQIYNATGKAGQSEKQIQAFKVVDVVPPWFDFAVFSVDEIRK